MNLLITGAAGHVATLALPGLMGHALRLADLHAPASLPARASFHRIDLLQASPAVTFTTGSAICDWFTAAVPPTSTDTKARPYGSQTQR